MYIYTPLLLLDDVHISVNTELYSYVNKSEFVGACIPLGL